MKIFEIRQAIDEKMESLQGILDTAEAREDSTFTEEEQRNFDNLNGEVDELKRNLANAEKAEEIRKHKIVKQEPRKSEEEKIQESFSLTEAVRQAKSGNLTGLYAELNQQGEAEAREAGVDIQGEGIVLPEMALRAENTAVSGAQPADGGNLIPTDRRGFIEHLYDQTVMNRAGVQMLGGLQGTVEMPTEDSVVSAAWATEIEEIETQKAGFGKETMAPKRLAVAVAYSSQLLRQSSPSIDAVLRRQLDQAIAQKLDDTFINGATDLDGLSAATGSIAAADFDYDMLLELLQKGEEANLSVQKIVSSAKARVKFMKEYTNSGVSGLPVLTGDKFITGQDFLSSNKVSNTAGAGTDETEIFAFDPNQFYVGAWGGVELIVDPYTSAKAAKVELVVNSFWDMLMTRKAKAYKASIAIA